jgi:hypothetical protein
MTGPSDGWAVGFLLPPGSADFRAYTVHWDGRRWRTVPVPAAAHSISDGLNAVDALSPSNAWAVGDSLDNTSAPMILHWNGHRWALVRSAPVPHYRFSSLESVVARSPNDIWAVGDAENGVGAGTPATAGIPLLRTLIEHWDGHRWSVVASPNQGDLSQLSGVTVARDGSMWAVGNSLARTGPFILRWTGRAWVRAAVPRVARGADVDLQSVTAVSPRQAWAVGDIRPGAHSAPRPYALRWDGHAWRSVPVTDPDPGDNDRPMISVTAFGHGQLAAVGYTSKGPALGAVYSRWNGHSWSVVAGPRNKGNDLEAVTSDGRRLWAVGTTGANRFVPFIQVSR